MKRVLAFILSLCIMLPLTACGEDTLESVIDDARDFMEDIDNVHCSTLTTIDMTEGDEKLSNYMSISADMDPENNIYFLKLTNSNSNNENIAMDIYITTEDTINYYMFSNNKWMKMTNVDPQALNGLDIATDVRGDFETHFNALLESGTATMEQDDIEGTPLYRIHSQIKISSIEMAKEFGLETFITGLLGDNASVDVTNALLDSLGPVELSVFINRETYAPYGFMLDLKPALDALYKNIGSEDVVVNEACTYSVYTDYDEIDEITLPEAAKRAPDISSMQQA